MHAMPLSTPVEGIALPEMPAAGDWPEAMGVDVAPGVFSTSRLWTWQILPSGILYRSYLAGPNEPRFASQWFQLNGGDWFWDLSVGGRVGLLRYGTTDPVWPEGFELDLEGAAFPRLAMNEELDLIASDFRFGAPLTFRSGVWETKVGYYHISSHLGDEYFEDHPADPRINYVRDALVWGLALRPAAALRFYGEVGWAFHTDGGAEPWEFQVGADLSPGSPTGFGGAPFAAVNSQFREEVDFGGSLTVQAGWAWRGNSGHLLRLGLHYLNGKSNQLQFFRHHEEQIGVGLWFDY